MRSRCHGDRAEAHSYREADRDGISAEHTCEFPQIAPSVQGVPNRFGHLPSARVGEPQTRKPPS
jgi:hypothetical protein